MTKIRINTLVVVILVSLAILWGIAAFIWGHRSGTNAVVHPGIRGVVEDNLVAIANALGAFEDRHLTAKDPPWSLFHGLLGRGSDYTISGEHGDTHSCLNWLLAEASYRPLFKMTPLTVERDWGISFTHGPTPDIKEEFEDHFCQFLFTLMELGVSPKHTAVRVPPEGSCHTLVDMVRAAESFCHGQSDLSWALPVFAKWGTRRKWTNKFGSELDLNQLVAQHLKREEWCDACFGTHWRMGLALGLKYGAKKISRSLRLQAQQRLSEAVREARNSQDDSGQFRLQWGIYPARPPGLAALPPLPSDRAALLSHQGHMLEWLMVALSDYELAQSEWPQKGISWLLTALGDAEKPIPYGAHSHCVHALRLYQTRMRDLAGGAH
jgi:hypothetical protein